MVCANGNAIVASGKDGFPDSLLLLRAAIRSSSHAQYVSQRAANLVRSSAGPVSGWLRLGVRVLGCCVDELNRFKVLRRGTFTDCGAQSVEKCEKEEGATHSSGHTLRDASVPPAADASVGDILRHANRIR